MQDGNGKIDRLVRWFKKRDVSIRYLILFVVLISPAIIWNVKNIYFGTFEIDDGSARYLLSALLQSQAAIIAIVVTMTLVAVQLTASTYSPRVIDIFKNDRVMWLLLVWYGLSMFFGVFVLETIGSEYSNLNPWSITVSLEFYVFLAYLMGIVAFAGLFWHVGNVINFLKPKNIIGKLSEEITRKKVLDFIEFEEKQRADQTEPVKDDPVQPIVDIIHGSVMKFDIATTGYGLKAITEKAIEVVRLDYEKEISEHFCAHLMRIGKLAVSRADGESTIKVLEKLEFFGKSTAEEELKIATRGAAKSLGNVGRASAKKGLGGAAWQAARSLGNVGKASVEKGLGGAAKGAARSLGNVGRASVEKGLEGAAREAAKSLKEMGVTTVAMEKPENATLVVVNSLRDVGRASVEKGLNFAALVAVESLGFVGKASAEKELEDAAKQAAWYLGGVGKAATGKKELEDVARQAAGHLEVVGKAAAEKKLDDAVWQAAWSLGDVGTAAVGKGLKRVALRAVLSLEVIGAAAAEKGLGHEASRAVLSLGGVGKAATGKKELEDVAWQAAGSLVAVGTAAVEKRLEDSAKQAAWSLAELTISSEEITKNAIQDYELQLQEQDRDPFRKFMPVYEQELEKLRAKKSE
jgi:hypothetical protein